MKTQFEVQPLRREDYEEWNKFAKVHKNATIFHTIEWKKVLEETFGYKPAYLVTKNSEGEIVGISPAFSVKTLFGNVIVSQPFFEYGGPIIERGFGEAYKEVLDFYGDKVENERIKYVEIKVLPDGENEHFGKTGFVKQFKAYGFYIDVKGKNFEKDIWLGLYTKKSRVRNSVKKAMKSGVMVVEDDDIDIYYELYIKTIAKLGSPPYPKTLFENIKKYADSSVRFTYAYLKETPIAAMMSFPYNNRDLMVSLVSDENYQECRANDLLYNEQIEYATKNGFEIVDFGRTRPDSPYERYKKKWGATKIDLYSYVYPPSTSEGVNPYKYYLMVSRITKKVPWIFTKTGIGPYLVKKFP
ncbi:MAG: Acetyltransferase (GNAT) domain protein [Candidatus Argoarchaeum ethanivorans]|uniref:Acetyltransferase (GNAT) domain protein n=1 Tax=Candidatus Argoarchaeum ethanivorans TaxID=2608793 RepID=A0A811T744_9EURY|nr:MAG: Acetyltransferase (GNAT) domain protein [Candidatus Argoarchaeum ethanivorans]